MLQSESRCLAIEAKWTEPAYETVSKWRGDKSQEDNVPQDRNEPPTNREQVLGGWLELLKKYTRPDLWASIAARHLLRALRCRYQLHL
jgi:hypothetical protein